MKDWLLNILRAPDSGAPLQWSPEKQCLTTEGHFYRTTGEVASFVDGQATTGEFDYARHYATDAEQFDYFEAEDDALTAAHLGTLRTTVIRSVPAEARLVLDVGCGCAYVAEHLCSKGLRVVSLDIAITNVQKALSQHPYDNHAGVEADAYHLPFADGTFDCIIASEIIEHTVEPRAFLASLTAKLKPGGTLLVSTPYKERIAYSLCIHCNCKTPHNAHLHSFDENSMKRMAATIPLDITRIRLVGNKLLLRTHLTRPLTGLGYGLWSLCDRLANRLVHRTEHFIITFRRPA